MDYHTEYDEPNTNILLALADEAPQAIKAVIASFNVNKRTEDFRKEIIQENARDVLIQTTEFLKSPPKSNNIKSIAKAITIGIQNLLYELCEKCQDNYVITLHATPSLRCQTCNQAAHEHCYGICKSLPGIEWSCSSCNSTGIQAGKDEEVPKPGDSKPEESHHNTEGEEKTPEKLH